MVKRISKNRSNFTQERQEIEKIEYFSSASLGLCTFTGEGATETRIEKPALVMVEGHHKDSSNRPHYFSAARVRELVESTNEWLKQGGRVPWQRDHKKDQANNIGDLEDYLELRKITAEDLPNPNLTKLIGKVGAFTNKLVGKGKDVVDQILAGRIKTLSPGIDIENNIIREISATPTPAIVGLSTFKKSQDKSQDRANFADTPPLTMDDADDQDQDEEEFQQQVQSIALQFSDVAINIMNATDDELQGNAPEDYLYQLVQDTADRLATALGLGDANSPPYDNPADFNPLQNPMNQVPGYNQSTGQTIPAASRIPNYLKRQQGLTGGARMQSGKNYAKFQMSEIEKTANFGFGGIPKPNFSVPNFGQKKPQQDSTVGNVAKTAAAGAGILAAAKYGGKAAQVAGRAFNYGKNKAASAGAGKIGSTLVGIKHAAQGGAGNIGGAIKKDIGAAQGAVKSGVGKLKDAVSAGIKKVRAL